MPIIDVDLNEGLKKDGWNRTHWKEHFNLSAGHYERTYKFIIDVPAGATVKVDLGAKVK